MNTRQARMASRRSAQLDAVAGQIAEAISALTTSQARVYVERAIGNSGLPALRTHLREHPDALTASSSNVPKVMLRLITLLAEEGHLVAVPGCARCGRQVRWHGRIDGGRGCSRCLHANRRAICTRCGKDRSIAGRDELGRPCCGYCRTRRTETCATCGQQRPAHRRLPDGSPQCQRCYQRPERRCSTCGELARITANTPTGPVCQQCYQRPKRRCGACGRHEIIRRLATADSPELCGRCAHRKSRPCTICASVYPAHPTAQKPVCLPCRDAGHITEPDLIEAPPISRRPHGTTVRDLLSSRVQELFCHPEHGLAPVLTPLVEVLVTAPNPPTVLTWISRNNGAALLRELAVRAHTEPLTHALVDSLGSGYAVHRLRELLVHTEILPAREELLDRVEGWLDDTLAQQPDHIAAVVRPYATWHVLRRARQRARRRPVTTNSATYNRSQIQIAIRLLTWLDQQGVPLAELTQPDFEQWLLESRRYHSFIAGFIGWARARKLCGPLLVPPARSADPDLGLPEHQRWAELERCIRDAALPHDVRAAGILVLLYGRALTECAELTTDAIEQRSDTAYLRLPEISIEMPPAVASVFAALIESSAMRPFQRPGNARYLFPSEMPSQPTRGFVLARKLRAHGINGLSARHSARAAWSTEIPSPIAADLLGINISTATRWATRSKRDWTDYLAARAEAGGQ